MTDVKIETYAEEVLKKAITRLDLAKIERDSPGGERSMQKACDIFKAWTGIKLNEEDGWRFMICLKQAREIQGKFNVDDYVDIAGYSSLLAESEGIISRTEKPDFD